MVTVPFPYMQAERLPLGGHRRLEDVLQNLPLALNAHEVIQGQLTIGGRLPSDLAGSTLTPFAQTVLDLTSGQNFQYSTLTGDTRNPFLPANACFVAQEIGVGHVYVLTKEDLGQRPVTAALANAGVVQFDPQTYEALMREKRLQEEEFTGQVEAEITPALNDMQARGELEATLETIRTTLIHINPVFYFVGPKERLYSTFDRTGKNLLSSPRSGQALIRSADRFPQDIPVSAWSAEDKTFVYGMHLLLASGGATRLEELNGGQLSPAVLHSFFNDKAPIYAEALVEDMPQNFTDQSLMEKAQWLATKLTEVKVKKELYRRVNGLLLRKIEGILGPKDHVPDVFVEENICQQLFEVFGIGRNQGEPAQDYWQRLTGEVITQELEAQTRDLTGKLINKEVRPLPLLIWTIVNSAINATGADMAATRSFRSIKTIRGKDVKDLTNDDFFCCAVPSQELAAAANAEELAEALKMTARRMAYNGKHMITVNGVQSDVVGGGTSLRPFGMPDISYHEELLHGGHTQIGVHYALRYPGIITADNMEIKGVFDLALVRREEPPFEPEDIYTAQAHIAALNVVFNTVIAHDPPVDIDVFTGEWYKNNVWQQYSARINS